MSANGTQLAEKLPLHTAPVMAPGAADDAVLNLIERAARDPNVNIEKISQLLAMREGVAAKMAEQAFNAAMATTQAEMQPVATDSDNPQTRSKYASYAALDKAVRPIYTRHGFALSFNTEMGAAENHVRIVCHATHESGHTRRYQLDMPADGKGAKGGDVMTKTHAIGSGITYGQRYLLKMIFNIAIGERDDDGNAAGDTGASITAEQVETIQSMIAETASDIQRFCRFMKVARIEDIPSKDYDRAVKALEAKRAKS